MIKTNQEQHNDVDIFFAMSLGNWLTQKTSYNPGLKKHTTSKTKTSINRLNKENTTIDLGEDKKLKNISSGGTAFVYNVYSEKGESRASSVLTYAKDLSSASSKRLYKFCKSSQDESIKGTFELIGGVLKVLVKINTITIEEKIWFVNNNVRLTRSTVKDRKHCVLISFASEIKIIQKQ
nr:Ycf58 [Porphyrostromium japonicum]